MATHSSTLAWEIPWTEEPGGLQSMGSQRVGHNLVTKPPNPYWDVFTIFSVIVEIHYFIFFFSRYIILNKIFEKEMRTEHLHFQSPLKNLPSSSSLPGGRASLPEVLKTCSSHPADLFPKACSHPRNSNTHLLKSLKCLSSMNSSILDCSWKVNITISY